MRINGINPSNAPDLVKPVFQGSREAYGRVITPALVMGHRPEILVADARLEQAIGASSSVVEPRLKRLAVTRAAQMIGYPF
jgi:hypothetical protein